jgi:hypothetical protein
MSEEEWLTEQAADGLLRLVPAQVSGRKFRLFACQCARDLLPHNPYYSRAEAIEIAERVADGTADGLDVRGAFDRADFLSRMTADAASFSEAAIWLALLPDPREAATRAFENLVWFDTEIETENPIDAVVWLREIFGNPFRPVDFSAWRTDDAVALARQMYESRDFGAMPILADALQEAGCDNADVLNHCRDAAQTHFRGCWVVDGVLGLE